MRPTQVVATVASELLWRPSEHANKCTTHPLPVAEAGRVRQLLGRVGAFFEHHASDFCTQRLHSLGGRLTRLLSERARELTNAQMRSCGKFLDRKV